MTTRKDGGAAYPRPLGHDNCGTSSHSQEGMTLRDWFAGQVIAGIYANSLWLKITADRHDNQSPESLASDAYEQADAMIAQRALLAEDARHETEKAT